MSVYTGIFNTTKNPTQLNASSFAAHILRRQPNGNAPLFAFTSMTGTSKAKSSTHGYFSKTLEFSRVVVDGATLANATTLTVDSTAGIVPGMVLYNAATGENLRVLTVASATSLTVTRSFGRIAAAGIADDQVLVAVGTSYEEGSKRPVPRSIQAVYVSNFTQIFRNAWALTDTARASYSELGYSNVAENQRDCMTFHSMDIEAALFFGQAKMDTTGATPLHSTQGVIDAVRQYAPNNFHDASAVDVGYDDLVDYFEGAFAYSTDLGDSKTRVAFVDSAANKVIQKIGKDYSDVVTLTPQKTGAFGLVYSEFRFYKGSVMIIEHPLFNGLQAIPGLCVLVDIPAVKLAYMDGRNALPETFKPGGVVESGASVLPGVDALGGSLTSELAVELINPQGCVVIVGMLSAAARVVQTFETNPAMIP